MRVHYINVQRTTDGDQAGRNSTGGRPILTGNQPWPVCRLCKSRMILFFQLDIEKKHDLALKPGSHLLVFMCPIHNDAPMELLTADESLLPEEYWKKDFGHYKLLLNKNPKDEHIFECDEHIRPGKLVFNEAEEEIDWDGRVERGTPGFKIGGVPSWELLPQLHKCSCGAEMIFVAQVPQFFNFIRQENAPVQPDTHDPAAYNLFMGKHAYIFACKEQCTPESLYVVSQEIESSADEVAARVRARTTTSKAAAAEPVTADAPTVTAKTAAERIPKPAKKIEPKTTPKKKR
jgi:hypothetical protein